MTSISRRELLRRGLSYTAAGVCGSGAASLLTGCGAGQRVPNPPTLANSMFSQKDLQTMEDAAHGVMAQYMLPGLSIAISKDDGLMYAQGFGMADLDSGQPVTEASRFRIASVSKPITATTILRLVETGKLNLQQPVFGNNSVLGTDYGAPPYEPMVQSITVGQLLMHTEGGWPEASNDPVFQASLLGLSQHDLVQYTVHNTPLQTVPGSAFAYSNFGYVVLGRVIEKITGKSYAQAVSSLILGQCGIGDMSIASDVPQANEVTYYPYQGTSEEPYTLPISRLDSAGGWIATATDIVMFLQHVDFIPTIADILQSNTMQAMATPSPSSVQAAYFGTNTGYGEGWVVPSAQTMSDIQEGIGAWWHHGNVPGTTAYAKRTNNGYCWAAITNTRVPTDEPGSYLQDLVENKMIAKVNWPY